PPPRPERPAHRRRTRRHDRRAARSRARRVDCRRASRSRHAAAGGVRAVGHRRRLTGMRLPAGLAAAFIALHLGAAACATAPAVAPPAPAGPTFEQKMAWMLRLEDHRVLRDPAPAIPPAPAPPPVRGRKAPAPAVAPPPPPPDLVRLLADAEPRVRRRAALAIGRVGLREGVAPLVALLADGDPEVRQMAAFALGLI